MTAYSYGIIPVSGQFEQRAVYQESADGTTSFAFADELIAHYAASIFNKSTLQNACLFRVTRNADITVDEGMMDHDIDFRDVMSELLKKRRKLAAVRLQFWPRRSAGDRQVPAGQAGGPGGPLLYPNFAAGPRASVPPGQPRFGRQQPPLFPIRQLARFKPPRIMICMPKPTNMMFCSLTRTRASARSSAC